MLKIITIILIALIMILISGCSNTAIDASIDTYVDTSKDNPSESRFLASIPIPAVYGKVDVLLSEIGLTKFSEFDMSERSYSTDSINALKKLCELYKPGYVKEGFILEAIPIQSSILLSLFYYNAETDQSANFEWERYMLVENATKDFLSGYAAAEYIEERNGVTYAIKEWASRETGEHASYEVGWAQHGQVFTGDLPASFTLEEVLAFCDAQPIEAWELLGDAVSVSIQDMENVSIFENDSVSKMPSRSSSNEIIAVDDVLYKSVNMEKVGYRWLIDENTTRYQYVLAPDTYEFHASGVGNDPELLIKHFEAGDIMATEDLTSSFENPAVNGFILTVAPEGIVEFTVDTEPYAIEFVQNSYSASIPASGSTTATVAAYVVDQYGNAMPNYEVTYALQSPYNGVSVNGSTGVVTIQSSANAGTVYITASYETLNKTVSLTLTENIVSYNFRCYLESGQSSVQVGNTIYVDVMLSGDLNFSQIMASITYDTALLEYVGYENLFGWVASVNTVAPNKVTVQSLPTQNMLNGAPCSPPVRIVTLKFTALNGLTGPSIDTDLDFSAITVQPPAGIIGATTAPGEPLTITVVSQ